MKIFIISLTLHSEKQVRDTGPRVILSTSFGKALDLLTDANIKDDEIVSSFKLFNL